ncbi:hypothetical protein AB0K18_42955 [Nonomuraea sp. NPDC049421]|uniref:hypothetical protein n=1 Tax=Nonomuraea sp. NPDC049421 TaxID=3155275 RepID=UPI0034455B48
MGNAPKVSEATYRRPIWATRHNNRVEPFYASEAAAWARGRELGGDSVTLLRHEGTSWVEHETGERPATDWPQLWTLTYEGGRGMDEHTFASAAEAIGTLVAEAREGWHQLKDLGRDYLPAEPPADDVEAIVVFHTALDIRFSLDVKKARMTRDELHAWQDSRKVGDQVWWASDNMTGYGPGVIAGRRSETIGQGNEAWEHVQYQISADAWAEPDRLIPEIWVDAQDIRPFSETTYELSGEEQAELDRLTASMLAQDGGA